MHGGDVQTTTHSSIVCSNCGKIGHVYRGCPYPVTSYGIICYRIVPVADSNSVRPEYLMVQRKDSLGFVEFVRGKYDSSDHRYIAALLTNMTVTERQMLVKDGGDIDALWAYLWRDLSKADQEDEGRRSNHGFNGFAKDLEEARSKFGRIRESLPQLLSYHPSEIKETEWGFPKGRRNISETDMECAVREFSEETGLNSKHVKFMRDKNFVEEMFQGSNGVWYKHIYFVAKGTQKIMQHCDESGRYKHCNGEIRAVQWFSYEECLDKIRPVYPRRRGVLETINSSIIDAMKSVSIATLTPQFCVSADTQPVYGKSSVFV